MEYLTVLFLQMIVFFVGGTNNPQKHFAFLFALIIYFVYIFLGPLNSFLTDDYYQFGAYFGEFFGPTLFLYNVAIFSLGVSYFVFFNATRPKLISHYYGWQLSKHYYVYLVFFFGCVAYIISRKAGVSEDGSGFSGGFLNYLTFMSDSLIVAFLILLSEKKLKKWHLILLVVTILFYLILGFRYRIIILLVGVLYHFFIVNKLSPKSILKWGIYIALTFYIINFISTNRGAFREMDFQNIEFSSDSPYELSPYQFVMHQTSNHKTDMIVHQYMEQNNQVEYDFGESMFYHILVRIIPATFFEGDVKPSIPQQEIIRNSSGTTEGYSAGSAVTNVLEYYIAGGITGIIIMMSFMGSVLGYISKRTDLNRPRDRVIVMIAIMVLFQEITRGYWPQNFTLLCFLYLTFFLFYKKKYARSSN